MPFINEHAARLREPKIFNPSTFRRTIGGKVVLPGAGLIELPAGVSTVWGKIKGRDKKKDSALAQSLRFNKKTWTAPAAEKWLKDNKVTYIIFEKAKNTTAMDEQEILLYTSIWGDSAEAFIARLNEVPIDDDVTVRLNCPGGSVFAGWGMIAKMKERVGNVNIKVDGHAASMACFMLLYVDYAEAIDTAQFMLHRATGYVDNPDDQKLLDSVNADLKKALKARINAEAFKRITGITIEELFTNETRRDIWITAKEAKEIGLINKIVRLKPTEIAALSSKLVAFANFSEDNSNKPHVDGKNSLENPPHVDDEEQTAINNSNNSTNQNTKKMTLEEFKAQNPSLYAEIVKVSTEAGAKAEYVRVKTLLAFIEHDKEGVVKMIKEKTEVTPDVTAELMVKMAGGEEAEKIDKDNAPELKTKETKTPVTLTAEQIKKDADEVIKNLKG